MCEKGRWRQISSCCSSTLFSTRKQVKEEESFMLHTAVCLTVDKGSSSMADQADVNTLVCGAQ
eukprot:scaffold11544_cov101-Skeletonema_dohrnii-CCMP3373.AAC.4